MGSLDAVVRGSVAICFFLVCELPCPQCAGTADFDCGQIVGELEFEIDFKQITDVETFNAIKEELK